jgi:hypothetical protein
LALSERLATAARVNHVAGARFAKARLAQVRHARPAEVQIMSLPDDLFRKIKMMPPQRLAEVADFVDFLAARDEKARTQKVNELFAMMDQLAAVEPTLTPEEIQAEIDAARAERRAGPHARRR